MAAVARSERTGNAVMRKRSWQRRGDGHGVETGESMASERVDDGKTDTVRSLGGGRFDGADLNGSRMAARRSTRRRRARQMRFTGSCGAFASAPVQDPCEAIRRTRPRNHRVCDLGRSTRKSGWCTRRFRHYGRADIGRDYEWGATRLQRLYAPFITI